jgi:hypothetical protein
MPPAEAPVCALPAAPARRGATILAARIAGRSIEAIAASEGLTRKRIETLLRVELRRRGVASATDFARLQIARLEALAATLAPLAAAGETAAIDRMLKILDRLDRYHGFSKLAPAIDPPHEGGRARLLAKLNAMAERMIAARQSGP